MTGCRSVAVVILLGGAVCGCTGGPTLPTLSLLPTVSETGAAPQQLPQAGPFEASLWVPGTPTEVFTQVAHGALGCWFGATGPLKTSHVYRAEADPPAKGGDAQIVLYERDLSLRDQRGPRAYHISFTSDASAVRVISTALKFDQEKAQAMGRDVATWAKGGEGCQLRALFPPPPAPAKTAQSTTKKTGTGPAQSKSAVGQGQTKR